MHENSFDHSMMCYEGQSSGNTTTSNSKVLISSSKDIQADCTVKRIVPFVSPRLTTILPKEGKAKKSPWFDNQRHIQLRDNITKEQR